MENEVNSLKQKNYHKSTQCCECGMWMQDNNLKRHSKKHKILTENKELEIEENNEFGLIKPYSCGLCKKTYFHEYNLNIHYLDIHCYERFHCSVCDKYFVNNEDLYEHFQSNHVFYKFLCDKCGKMYCSKGGFKEHYDVIHSKIELKCDLCNYTCKYRRCLNRHISSVHRREKYTCYCGKIYSLSDSLRRHQRFKNHLKPNSDIVL